MTQINFDSSDDYEKIIEGMARDVYDESDEDLTFDEALEGRDDREAIEQVINELGADEAEELYERALAQLAEEDCDA